MLRFAFGTLAVLALVAVPALAQPVIDGVADPMYCGEVVVQDTQTGFGDSDTGRYDFASGSELDGAYATVVNDTLYLVFSGNLQTNGNKLEIFFDTRAGGQNQLLGVENPDIDYGALQRMGDDGTGNGLTFDSGFEADFYLTLNAYGDPTVVNVAYAELYVDAGNPGVGYYLGEGQTRCDTTGGQLIGGDPSAPFAVLCTLDNSNVAGVTGGFGTDNGAGVKTGVELAIPLSAIGSPTGDFDICAFINGQQHDFLSNQVLAGIFGNPTDNLGEPRDVDLSAVFWDQFFTVPNGGDPCGACCVGTTCTVTTEDDCVNNLGGTYLGDNTSCDGNPCDAIATGACCVAGLCTVETEADCLAMDGIYLGDGTDCSLACDCLAYGACCVGITCTIETEDYCVNTLGGNWLGPYTDCSGDPCATGACCIDLECFVMTEVDCAAADGVYLGNGTNCDDDPCVGGACCIGNLCFMLPEIDCLALGGTYQGDYTDCTGDPCDSPVVTASIDGSCEQIYERVILQDTQTGFGDAIQGLVDFAYGSELDGASARIANGRLYLCLAGNLESNFNKAEFFFDTRAGGQNKLLGAENPDVDYGALQRMGDDGTGNGLTFDTGFEPDFWVSVTGGNNPYQLYVNYAELYVDEFNPGVGYYLGQGRAADKTHGGLLDRDLGGSTDPYGFLCTLDNSNVEGVAGGFGLSTAPENPEDVMTGIEISIPLEAIGITGEIESLMVCAFVNGGGHDWISNQVLGPVSAYGGDNFGEPRLVDFQTVPGDQWFLIEWCTGQPRADSNCDGVVNGFDIDAFVLALNDEVAWNAIYGTSCDFKCVNDVNGDGEVNGFDIDAFVAELSGG
ncbi:MAG: hypothetical protein KKB50_19175 [Planctomycetes bacterium]|nr:hypothetical protein [Planctomycetota bacterium]